MKKEQELTQYERHLAIDILDRVIKHDWKTLDTLNIDGMVRLNTIRNKLAKQFNDNEGETK